jgi:hydrogenase large subunit
MSEASRRIIAGPFNRVEGDLEIRLDIEDGRVVAAYANSPLFRGFERMLDGKDPRDCLTIVPRICGICSVSQSMAASRALAAAQGLRPPPNGARVAAIIHAAENIADHLTHFHVFFMADFARAIYADRPWHAETARLFQAKAGEAVRSAMEARAQLLHIMGLLAGKWPHTLSIQPGGVTKTPDGRDRMRLLATIRKFRQWAEDRLFGDTMEAIAAIGSLDALAAWRERTGGGHMRLFLAIADDLDLGKLGKGPPRFLSYGAYPVGEGHLFAAGARISGRATPLDTAAITEDVAHSWMLGPAAHPFAGQTVPDTEMRDTGYSWCKAPRLAGATAETGAFARQLIDGHSLAESLLADGRANVRARVVGRLLEIALTVPAMERWVQELAPGEPYIARGKLPDSAEAEGLTEAARGALGHWLVIRKGRIASYQIVAPTTWNFSPRDAAGVPGPVEEALAGAPVLPGETTPVAVQHIVRSFDPCMVCTVH